MKYYPIVFALIFVFQSGFSFAETSQNKPYDENADSKKIFESAISKLEKDKYVLVVFGANWCKDCIILDERMRNEPLKSFVKDKFVVVKVDVGEWDRNLDFVSSFGNPIEKGIPSIAIVNSNKDILQQTNGGQLATVRKQSGQATYEYIKGLVMNLGKNG